MFKRIVRGVANAVVSGGDDGFFDIDSAEEFLDGLQDAYSVVHTRDQDRQPEASSPASQETDHPCHPVQEIPSAPAKEPGLQEPVSVQPSSNTSVLTPTKEDASFAEGIPQTVAEEPEVLDRDSLPTSPPRSLTPTPGNEEAGFSPVDPLIPQDVTRVEGAGTPVAAADAHESDLLSCLQKESPSASPELTNAVSTTLGLALDDAVKTQGLGFSATTPDAEPRSTSQHAEVENEPVVPVASSFTFSVGDSGGLDYVFGHLSRHDVASPSVDSPFALDWTGAAVPAVSFVAPVRTLQEIVREAGPVAAGEALDYEDAVGQMGLNSPTQKEELDTPAPKEELDTPILKEELDTSAPKEELDTPGPKEELDTPGPKEELDTPALKEELDTPAPKEELDTPAPKDNTCYEIKVMNLDGDLALGVKTNTPSEGTESDKSFHPGPLVTVSLPTEDAPEKTGPGKKRLRCRMRGNKLSECPEPDDLEAPAAAPDGSSTGKTKKAKSCFTCGSQSHISKKCPQKKKAVKPSPLTDGSTPDQTAKSEPRYELRSLDHMAREGLEDKKKAKECHACSEPGHMAKQCPTQPGGDGTTSKTKQVMQIAPSSPELTVPRVAAERPASILRRSFRYIIGTPELKAEEGVKVPRRMVSWIFGSSMVHGQAPLTDSLTESLGPSTELSALTGIDNDTSRSIKVIAEISPKGPVSPTGSALPAVVGSSAVSKEPEADGKHLQGRFSWLFGPSRIQSPKLVSGHRSNLLEPQELLAPTEKEGWESQSRSAKFDTTASPTKTPSPPTPVSATESDETRSDLLTSSESIQQAQMQAPGSTSAQDVSVYSGPSVLYKENGESRFNIFGPSTLTTELTQRDILGQLGSGELPPSATVKQAVQHEPPPAVIKQVSKGELTISVVQEHRTEQTAEIKISHKTQKSPQEKPKPARSHQKQEQPTARPPQQVQTPKRPKKPKKPKNLKPKQPEQPLQQPKQPKQTRLTTQPSKTPAAVPNPPTLRNKPRKDTATPNPTTPSRPYTVHIQNTIDAWIHAQAASNPPTGTIGQQRFGPHHLAMWTDATAPDPALGRVQALAVVYKAASASSSPEDPEWREWAFTANLGSTVVHSGGEIQFLEAKAVEIAVGLAVSEVASSRGGGRQGISKVTVFSDSQPALMAFDVMSERGGGAAGPFGQLRRYAAALAEKGVQVELRWVPGHAVVEGNEAADRLAGLASRLAPVPRGCGQGVLRVPVSALREHSAQLALAETWSRNVKDRQLLAGWKEMNRRELREYVGRLAVEEGRVGRCYAEFVREGLDWSGLAGEYEVRRGPGR